VLTDRERELYGELAKVSHFDPRGHFAKEKAMATDRDDEVWLHARHEISIVELADCAGLSEAEVRELVEYGALVSPMRPRGRRRHVRRRVRTAALFATTSSSTAPPSRW
jgi:hypothetical protein